MIVQAKHPSTSTRPLAEVFLAFLKLGLTSFGGPIAHLGYFRAELIVRRRWLSESHYADLVALCQFLPGPASSQVGFALGYLRGGLGGALLAWTAFTLPSAVLLLTFAFAAASIEGPTGQLLIHGLKLVAVAIVAQAVWGMARSLAPDRQRASIALSAVVAITVLPVAYGHVAAIALGALAGMMWCRLPGPPANAALPIRIQQRTGLLLIITSLSLLFGLPLLLTVWPTQLLAIFEVFYRAGALVFGGGHVMLPLLEARVVETGWVSTDTFLAGYGATQAVPGPLFTFAGYLGAMMSTGPERILAASIALVGIFLPGVLLLMGALPFWSALQQSRLARSAMAGANAAVVGLLATALYQPVWTGAVLSAGDFALALTGFVLLTVWKTPPWAVLILVVGTTVLPFFLSASG